MWEKDRVESGEKRVESGEWRVESGEWRVESGEWRVESGEWRVERSKKIIQTSIRKKMVSFFHYVDIKLLHVLCDREEG
jgi:hypothetical protein